MGQLRAHDQGPGGGEKGALQKRGLGRAEARAPVVPVDGLLKQCNVDAYFTLEDTAVFIAEHTG